jgi:hypothetical protein
LTDFQNSSDIAIDQVAKGGCGGFGDGIQLITGEAQLLLEQGKQARIDQPFGVGIWIHRRLV